MEHLFICGTAAVNLVEHNAVLDEQYAAGMACGLSGVRDHQNRLTGAVNLAKER